MKKIIIFILLILFSYCRKPVTTPPILEEDLNYYISILSSDEMKGRESGTEHAKKAAIFLEENYKRLKLYPAFEGKYVQNFTFSSGIEILSESKLILKGTSEYNPPFQILPFSKSGSFQGEVVVGGYCLKEDLHKQGETYWKNRAVICYRYGPSNRKDRETAFFSKYENLNRLGAGAVLFTGVKDDEDPDFEDFDINDQNGPPVFYLKFADIDPILKKNEPLKIQAVSSYKERKLTGQNVAAFIKPYTKGQKYIILGAHYDHLGLGSISSLGSKGDVHNGADDNASGVSSILEVGESLTNQVLPDNKNVLLIAFDAEERGLYGSEEFADSKFFVKDEVIAMINLDMVGRLRTDKGLLIQGTDTAEKSFRELVLQEASLKGFEEKTSLKLIHGGRGPSDHNSFYRKGVPVLFLFTGGHKEYHTEHDDVALINFQGLFRITGLTEGIVLGLLKRDSLPFLKPLKEPNRNAFEFSVRLGIQPDYRRSEAGVVVKSVDPAAPVAKKGLRPGDIVIQIGETKLKNLKDLRNFLSDASSDKEYRLVYMRNQQMIETKTFLMKDE